MKNHMKNQMEIQRVFSPKISGNMRQRISNHYSWATLSSLRIAIKRFLQHKEDVKSVRERLLKYAARVESKCNFLLVSMIQILFHRLRSINAYFLNLN